MGNSLSNIADDMQLYEDLCARLNVKAYSTGDWMDHFDRLKKDNGYEETYWGLKKKKQ